MYGASKRKRGRGIGRMEKVEEDITFLVCQPIRASSSAVAFRLPSKKKETKENSEETERRGERVNGRNRRRKRERERRERGHMCVDFESPNLWASAACGEQILNFTTAPIPKMQLKRDSSKREGTKFTTSYFVTTARLTFLGTKTVTDLSRGARSVRKIGSCNVFRRKVSKENCVNFANFL